MAIEKIPDIKAASFGGFIFDVSFSRSFSTEPSKLDIKIVNHKSVPKIGSAFSLSIGSFVFNGKIKSFEIEEGSSGNILSVSIVDNSIILDKIYVLVFRKGFFGEAGKEETAKFEVFFDEENFYTLEKNGTIKRNAYKDGSVDRKISGLTDGKFFGDILMVGKEEPPDNRCEIPNCSYTFNQLISGAGRKVNFNSAPKDDKLKQTYEGSLRSVLSSWCQDLGYSFYWDYRNDNLVFFDLKKDVFNLSPVESLKDKKITKKTVSHSSDGCFNQVGLSYIAQPFEPAADTPNLSRTAHYKIWYRHVPLSYFLGRDEDIKAAQDQLSDPGIPAENREGVSIYGGKRTSQEFWISSALGYAAPSLRKIYLYSWISSYGPHTGMKGISEASDLPYLAVSKVAKAMNLSGYTEDVEDLMKIAKQTNIENLDSDYVAFVCGYDQGLEEKWNDLEQSVFTQDYGSYYIALSPTRSNSVTFCSKTAISTCSVQVNPEPNRETDGDKKGSEKNSRIWNRGAPGPSKTQEEVSKDLSLEAWSTAIDRLLPRQISLKESSSFLSNLKSELPSANLDNSDTLFIIPKTKIITDHLKFSVSAYNGSNEREVTYREIESENKNKNDSCEIKDQNENKCLSAKEEVKLKQYDPEKFGAEEKEAPATGISNKSGKGITLRIGGQSSKFVSSSNASFRGVATYTNTVQKLFDKTKKKKIIFSGSAPSSNNNKIYETRVFVDNRTDFDAFSKKEISAASMAQKKTYSQLNDAKTVSITSAGFIDSISLSPDSGLSSFGLNISDAGFSVSYEFASRPKSFPSDDFIRKDTLSKPKTIGRFFSREII